MRGLDSVYVFRAGTGEKKRDFGDRLGIGCLERLLFWGIVIQVPRLLLGCGEWAGVNGGG